MIRSLFLACSGKQAATLAVLFSTLMNATAVWADPPAPFIMITEISFPEGSGTFAVQEPEWICPTGTFVTISVVSNPPVPGAFSVTAVAEYTCDDGSGTFYIQAHPQYNPGNAGDGFAVSGPWSILAGGTGDYEKLRGHGEMGFNHTNDPDFDGNETYAGLVSLND
jgi:hypothetical protein